MMMHSSSAARYAATEEFLNNENPNDRIKLPQFVANRTNSVGVIFEFNDDNFYSSVYVTFPKAP